MGSYARAYVCVNAHCNPRSKIRATAPSGVRDENKVNVLDLVLPGHPCAEVDALNIDKNRYLGLISDSL